MDTPDAFKANVMKLLEFCDPDVALCSICNAWMTHDECAGVCGDKICPREAFGGPRFPNEPCYKDEPGRMLVYESQEAWKAERRLGKASK